jgi:hypothetical protein
MYLVVILFEIVPFFFLQSICMILIKGEEKVFWTFRLPTQSDLVTRLGNQEFGGEVGLGTRTRTYSQFMGSVRLLEGVGGFLGVISHNCEKVWHDIDSSLLKGPEHRP